MPSFTKVKLAGNTYIEDSGGFVVPVRYSIQAQGTGPAVVVCTANAIIPTGD